MRFVLITIFKLRSEGTAAALSSCQPWDPRSSGNNGKPYKLALNPRKPNETPKNPKLRYEKHPQPWQSQGRGHHGVGSPPRQKDCNGHRVLLFGFRAQGLGLFLGGGLGFRVQGSGRALRGLGRASGALGGLRGATRASGA